MSPSSSPTRLEVHIDNTCYDITDFMKRHPGGSVISFFQGTDATLAFQEFHSRSKKALKVLRSLPSRPLTPAEISASASASTSMASLGSSASSSGYSVPSASRFTPAQLAALTKDFIALRRQFEQEGLFDPSPAHVAYRYAELFAMFAVGLALVHFDWVLVGLVVLGVASGRSGWLMHEAGHYSLTGNIWWDRLLQELTYGFGIGLSGAYWRNQHNKHHAAPQRLQHDVDLATLPLVAFHTDVIKEQGPSFKKSAWILVQAFTFPFVITSLVSLFWQLYLHPRYIVRTKNFREIAIIIARWCVVFYSASNLSWGEFIWMYLFCNMVGAAYIFNHFAVSHTHKPVSSSSEVLNWVQYSSEFTTNIEQSWWCDWLMGYLNFQIEHHLFPSMPQFRQKLISPRVKAFCLAHGLTYDVMSYAEAFKLTFSNLHEVGQEHWNLGSK